MVGIGVDLWSRMWKTARSGAGSLLDLALPPLCMACRAPVGSAHGLCPVCWGTLAFIERPYCEVLGIPFAYDIGAGARSAEAITDPPPYGRARAAVIYTGPAVDLVRGLKYNDRTDLARLIGRLTARAARDLVDGADWLIPIPLHRRRFLGRRFNQSAMVARVVAQETGVGLDVTGLVRFRATTPQVGLSAKARQANVAGAFVVTPEGRRRFAGRRVILVDDVITTGSTAAAATRALLRAGAAHVDLVAFARVPTGSLAADAEVEVFDFG